MSFAKARAHGQRPVHPRKSLIPRAAASPATAPRRFRRRSATPGSGCRSTRRASVGLRLLRQALHPEGRTRGFTMSARRPSLLLLPAPLRRHRLSPPPPLICSASAARSVLWSMATAVISPTSTSTRIRASACRCGSTAAASRSSTTNACDPDSGDESASMECRWAFSDYRAAAGLLRGAGRSTAHLSRPTRASARARGRRRHAPGDGAPRSARASGRYRPRRLGERARTEAQRGSARRRAGRSAAGLGPATKSCSMSRSGILVEEEEESDAGPPSTAID